MTDPIQTQKSQVRAQIRQQRQSISPAYALQAGQKLFTRLKQHPKYRSAEKIGCFWSFDGEINTQPIIKGLIQDKKLCYLPKIKPTKPNRLWFLPFNNTTPMKKNRMGIPEVALPIHYAERVSHLDILLMPLVAFDRQANRLGMGGGYYDATLSHFMDATWQGKRPWCIGIAFEQQQVEELPAQKWDFPLDGVMTEQEFYDFTAK